MEKSRYIKAFLLPFILLFSACTERIDIELDSTYTRLIVEGYVNTDSVRHRVRLSTSADFFSNQPTPDVSGALVQISYDSEQFLLLEDHENPGMYVSEEAFRGRAGTTYILSISDVDVNNDGESESYSASSTMPGGVVLDYIELKYVSYPMFSGYIIFMYGSHPPEQSDWLGYKVWKNSDLLTDTLSKYQTFSDDLFDDGGFSALPTVFLDESNPREALQTGDTVTFEVEQIERFYYDFVNAVMLESMGNIPLFTGPSANAPSNISNGGMGIFTAYSTNREIVVLN